MARELKNKIVVITGGAEGIGFEIADKFLENGAKLTILLDVNEEKGAESAKTLVSKYGEGKAVFIKCDITTDLDEISRKLFDEYKTIDVLVNNAGIVDENSARKTIEVNLIALMEWSIKFREHMRTDEDGKGGTIINLASKAGFTNNPVGVFYTTSKFGVIGFTKSFGHEFNFNRYGVRVIALCPAFTETKMPTKRTIRDPQTEACYQEIVKNSLWQKVEVVGNAAVEVFEIADSGTAWLIEGGNPIEQV